VRVFNRVRHTVTRKLSGGVFVRFLHFRREDFDTRIIEYLADELKRQGIDLRR
jgi:hypothetical protein